MRLQGQGPDVKSQAAVNHTYSQCFVCQLQTNSETHMDERKEGKIDRRRKKEEGGKDGNGKEAICH